MHFFCRRHTAEWPCCRHAKRQKKRRDATDSAAQRDSLDRNRCSQYDDYVLVIFSACPRRPPLLLLLTPVTHLPPPCINLGPSFTFDCSPAAPGSTSNFGAWECSECPPGFVSEARQYPCEPCAMGTFAEGILTYCNPVFNKVATK